MEKEDQKIVDDPRSEVILTGAALVGGAKLTYDIGKDIYSRFKSDSKLFFQVIRSYYKNESHHVIARIASAYIHSIFIEKISVSISSKPSLQAYIIPEPRISIGDETNKESVFEYPYLLEPGKAVDIHLVSSHIDDAKCKKNEAIELELTYAALNLKGPAEVLKSDIRLRWK